MKFKMLTAAMMALICAGTAAASQLNSVHVVPKATAATVTLQTTGSFAHKEYRPDAHLLLVDLTGVTSSSSLAHTVAVNSPLLKSYAISSYTNPSGTVVTRVELDLGDNAKAEVVDGKGGLEIQIQSGGAVASAAAKPVATAPAAAPKVEPSKAATAAKPAAPAPTPAAASKAAATPKPELAKAASAPKPAASTAPKSAPTVAAAPKVAPVKAASSEPAIKDSAAQKAQLATIRSVAVLPQENALDVVVEGPTSAKPYELKKPERLVMDFSNTTMQPSVKNVPVHTKDVLQVRVGRLHDNSRVVIDLSGPHAFEVLPAADRVVVRIKCEAAPVAASPKPASSASAPAAAAVVKPAKRKAAHVQAVAMAAAKPAEAPVPQPVVEAPAVKAPVVAQAEPRPEAAPVVASAATTPRQVKAAAEIARLVSTEVPQSIVSGSASNSTAKPKYTGEPISVNLKDVDLKDFFRLIHEISGLNVVLDPAVHGSVTLVLDDVPWDQALDIVLKNNGLDRELQGNVLRIAATDTLRREALDRRAQAEAVALAVDRQTITRTLSYAKATTVVPTIKKFLTARGDIISDDRTNTLIISDIPSTIPTIDKLIVQLDKKTQQVEIECRVVSANRAFSRDLGFQLGFGWGNGVSTVAGMNNVGTTTVSNPTTPTVTPGGIGSPVPLFSNFPAGAATTGLGFSNFTRSYAIDAVLTAAESHNLAKVLSRPRVVTQNNQKATVSQGVMIPVTSPGTFQSGAATTSYVNALLTLSVTPQITADNTVFMNVDVENTQPLSNDNPPRLSTQQANTQVIVSDGGTVVIGGVIQTSNTVRTNQTPGLGSIPWLGNLFKERSVQTETNELIFFITPKIM